MPSPTGGELSRHSVGPGLYWSASLNLRSRPHPQQHCDRNDTHCPRLKLFASDVVLKQNPRQPHLAVLGQQVLSWVQQKPGRQGHPPPPSLLPPPPVLPPPPLGPV